MDKTDTAIQHPQQNDQKQHSAIEAWLDWQGIRASHSEMRQMYGTVRRLAPVHARPNTPHAT